MAPAPLLLLPGLLLDERLYAAQVEALRPQCAPQVVDLTRDDSIAAMAGRVLAAAPERFAVRAVDGRLRRLRDHAPRAGAGDQAGTTPRRVSTAPKRKRAGAI
jgi:hypothetical protein